jgi:adenylate cyclase class IV
MPRNIEIKARLPEGPAAVVPRAQALGAHGPTLIEQDDSFYPAKQGRLKLRRLADGSAELIHYQRPDQAQAKASDYVRVLLPDASTAEALHTALSRAQGLQGRVRKQRWLLLLDEAGFHTRIHLDEVHDLGAFIELEVVLQPGQTDAQGQQVAETLMQRLGLAGAERLHGAYLDLLAQR